MVLRNLLVAAVATTGVALAIWMVWRRPPVQPHMRALVAAAGSQRLVEPRLSGGFAWGPSIHPQRSDGASRPGVSAALKMAALVAERDAASHRTSDNLHALGVSVLLVGDAARAIAVLQQAAGRAPTSAGIRADLAAAYLVRGTAGDQVRALDEAHHGAALDPNNAETWFNLALASEACGLVRQAADAWQRYVALDSASRWADEARRHLQSLSARNAPPDESAYRARLRAAATSPSQTAPTTLDAIVREAPALARRVFESDLIPAWAALVATPTNERAVGFSDDVSRESRAAKSIAEAIVRVTGDRMPRDAAAGVSALELSRPTAREVASGLLDYEEARQLYTSDRVSEAAPVFQRAAVPLTKHSHPFALWTRHFLAVDQYYRGDLAGAEASLRTLTAEADSRSFIALAGQCRWMRGLIAFTAGRFVDALDDYAAAIDRFGRLQDRESVAALQNLRAEVLDGLRESTLAWQAREEALRWLPEGGNPRRIHTILRATARAARDQSLTRAALAFQLEVVENARRWNRDGAMLEAVVGRSLILADLGQTDAAARDVTEALARLARFSDPLLARRFAIDVYTAAGEVAAKQGVVNIAPLSEAIGRLEWARADFARARLHLLRGRARLAAGQPSLAVDDFRQGMEIAERQRRATPGERLRLLASGRLWELHSELAQLELAGGAADRALETIERGRALSLMDDRSDAIALEKFDLESGSLDRVLDSAAVLYYAVLPKQVLCWTLTAQGHRLTEIAASIDPLRELVRTHHALAESGNDPAALDRVARQLYDVLVRPAIASLPQQTPLVIAPDDELHGLAFSALKDAQTGRYLLERHPIAIVPSLRVLAAATGAVTPGRPESPAGARVLVVTNPASPASAGFARLPDAKREGAIVASLYPRAQILDGPDATKQNVLRKLPGVTVFHYAGHAIANPALPSLSRLLLAPDRGGTTGAMLANEMTPRTLAQLRVVILAACRTADGELYKGEGIASVARPFLAAGVPAVVAGLWDVDDRASRELFAQFHRQLSAGASVGEALRGAQLSMARAEDTRFSRVGAWAAFQAFGAASVRVVRRQGQ